MSIIPSLECLYPVTFYHSLVVHTTVPLAAVAACLFFGRRATQAGREATGYLLTQGGFFLIFLYDG